MCRSRLGKQNYETLHRQPTGRPQRTWHISPVKAWESPAEPNFTFICSRKESRDEDIGEPSKSTKELTREPISREQILRCIQYAQEARDIHQQWEQHPLVARAESSLVGALNGTVNGRYVMTRFCQSCDTWQASTRIDSWFPNKPMI